MKFEEAPGLTIHAIVHGDDVDGLTCGAFLRRLTGCSVYMANYDNLEHALGMVTPPVKTLYVCDLNIREALLPEILRIREFADVNIIDHHQISNDLMARLRDAGVSVFLDTRDCAGVLVYDAFKDELGPEAARIAAYAAISDMFEDGPLGSQILAKIDRKFAQHEAQILTHAMSMNQTIDFKRVIMDELSRYGYPHRIPGAVELAVQCLEEMTDMKERISDNAVKVGRMAYMESVNEYSTGGIANLIIDTLGVDVGVGYKVNDEYANISLRGELMLDEHLGDISSELGEKYGGFGGGHQRASGVKIPKDHLEEFLVDLAEILS
jgi:oligoribonuclease NrnB/cAMP/cGMP phosphodiesterase (DHH superfamily)